MYKRPYLIELARKCNIDDEKMIRKANELLDLLERKTVACSESCKIAVCLELASNVSCGSISRETVIKYSGCKKPVYVKMLNIISKMLNLDKVYSVKQICLTLNVSEMQSKANSLLENYERVNTLSEGELDHPMYPCAAVIAACRLNKVRVNPSSIVEISRVKKIELESLTKQMEQLPSEKSKVISRKRGFAGNILPPLHSSSKVDNQEKIKSEAEIEDEYLQWKQKMLAE